MSKQRPHANLTESTAANAVFAQEAKNDMNAATSPAVSQMGTGTHPSINRNTSVPKS